MSTGLYKRNINLLNALKKKFKDDKSLVATIDTILEQSKGLTQVFVNGLFDDVEENKLTRKQVKGVAKSRLEAIKEAMGDPEPAEPPEPPATEPAMTPVGGAAGAGAGDVPTEPLGGGVGGEMGFSDKTLAELNTLMEKLNEYKPQLKGGAKESTIGFLSALLLKQGTIPRTVAEKMMDKYRTSIFVKQPTPTNVLEGISRLTDDLMKLSPKPKDTPSEPVEPPMEPPMEPEPSPAKSLEDPVPAPAPDPEEEKEEQRAPDPAIKIVKTPTDDKTPSGKVVDIDINRVPTKIELIPKERLSAEDKSIKQLQDDIEYFYREFKEKLKNIRKTKSNNLSILKRFHKRITGLLGGNLDLSKDLSKDDTDKKTMGIVIKGSEFIKEKLKEIILESSIDGLSAQDLLINISDESTGDKSKDAGQYQFKTNKISGKTYASGEPVYRYILNEDPEQTDKQSAVYKQPIHKIPNPKTMFRSQVITSRKAVANNPFINANQPTIRLKSIY